MVIFSLSTFAGHRPCLKDDHVARLPCSGMHPFCDNCLQTYLRGVLDNGNVAGLHIMACCNEDCHGEMRISPCSVVAPRVQNLMVSSVEGFTNANLMPLVTQVLGVVCPEPMCKLPLDEHAVEGILGSLSLSDLLCHCWHLLL